MHRDAHHTPPLSIRQSDGPREARAESLLLANKQTHVYMCVCVWVCAAV